MPDEESCVTPLEVKKKQFATSFRGYNPREVETFLEMTSLEMEGLISRKNSLMEALADKDRELMECKEREASIRKTLEGLQQIIEDERSRAEEKGKQIIREAELKASEILQRAQEEQSAIRNDIHHLQRMQREFLAKLGSLVDSYKKILDQDQRDLDEEVNIHSDIQVI